MFAPLMSLACSALIGPVPTAAAPDTRLFEMRTYYAAPGKLDALNARFRSHTLRLFRKHGMTNIGYWVPVDNKDNRLIYILAFPDRAARDKAFASFGADPQWQRAARESEKDGRLVDRVTSVFLKAADYSPAIRPSRSGPPRLFELRIYTAIKDRFGALNERFREHTVELFRKHRMTNIGYWTPVDPAEGADDTLVYILAHRDADAARRSWDGFGKDPDWVAARDASEKDGPILASPPKSVMMTPTDYSPTR